MEADVVGELAHQEDTTATAFAKIFWPGWVGYAFEVEPISFIGDPDCDAVPFFARPHLYSFGLLLAVAVNNSIRNGLGEADKNIALFVWV
jgi:hypothetical protein